MIVINLKAKKIISVLILTLLSVNAEENIKVVEDYTTANKLVCRKIDFTGTNFRGMIYLPKEPLEKYDLKDEGKIIDGVTTFKYKGTNIDNCFIYRGVTPSKERVKFSLCKDYNNPLPTYNGYIRYQNALMRLKCRFGVEKKKNGLHKEYYNDGKIHIEARYKDGKLDGLYKEYHKNGKLYIEANYKDGKLDGLNKKYNEKGLQDGELMYKDGKLDGLAKEWYENGNLRGIISYKNNKTNGISKFYHKNGKLHIISNSIDGKEDGVGKVYDEKGVLRKELSYKNGKREGLSRVYFKNGKLNFEIRYKNGKFDGFTRIYDKNGRLKNEILFKNNKVLKGVKYLKNGQKKKMTDGDFHNLGIL